MVRPKKIGKKASIEEMIHQLTEPVNNAEQPSKSCSPGDGQKLRNKVHL